MAASTNSGTCTGRLAADPRVFITGSGAKHVFLTVMVDRPFKNRATGNRDSDACSVEAWVRPETNGLGIYDHMGKGDLVSIGYAVRSRTFADEQTGEVQYAMSLVVEDVQLLESKATTQSRRIQHLQSQVEHAA